MTSMLAKSGIHPAARLSSGSRRSRMPEPRRGEVWFGTLDPVQGREQAGERPLLIVSDDLFNLSAADLVIALPLTTRHKGIPYHVEITPPEAGLRQRSFIKCEDVRSLSKARLSQRWGAVSSGTMGLVENRL